jgi:Ca2+-binding EF-hand superfamily protein
MKAILFAGAALLAVPALAQVATPAVAPAPKVHTRAEVQTHVAEAFAKLDANRDGFVTKAEADAQRGQMRAKFAERRADRREHRFEQLDTNNDGSINRAEFDAAHSKRDARVAEHGGKHMGKAMHRMGGMHGFGGHMFEMADANKDGKVSLQEAQGAALRHFDTADLNRDGQITREERQQMRQRMRGERKPG